MFALAGGALLVPGGRESEEKRREVRGKGEEVRGSEGKKGEREGK